MRILALDLATATGVAFGHSEAVPQTLTERLGEPGDSHPSRFSNALNMANILIKKFRPQYVVLEKPIAAGPVGGEARAQLALGLRACVMGVCKMRNVPVREYPISTVRKHFIGHGGLGGEVAKQAVLNRCRTLGWDVRNDNEGDACAVWDYARYQLARKTSLPPTDLFDYGTQNGNGNTQVRSGSARSTT